MRSRALAAVLLLAACTSSTQQGPASSPASPTRATPSTAPATTTPASSLPRTSAPRTRPRTSSPRPSSAPVTSAPPASAAAEQIFAAMTARQRVGQLLMVDCPSTGVGSATVDAITQYDVGSVILDGNSFAGVQETRAVTAQLQALAPAKVGLFIATDQEGGLVQRLQGPGFTRIVSAVEQGQIAPATLRGYARGWGAQLRQAGVNVNLAPVLDIVPPGFGPNPPIGDLDREFGHSPAIVTSHGLAVARGMAAAGVDATVKHFPGLGRVTGNTDTSSGVTDTVTTRNDPYLAPFRAAARAGVAFVMMSTAIYSRLDPGTPAAFSSTIITGILRGDLGYRGLVISDDVGGADQVSGFSVAQRAVRFVAAGGDVVLTVDATQAGEMTSALLRRAMRDPAFKRKVDAAALRVLQAKQARGLL